MKAKFLLRFFYLDIIMMKYPFEREESLGGIVTVYSEGNVGPRFMFSLSLDKVR